MITFNEFEKGIRQALRLAGCELIETHCELDPHCHAKIYIEADIVPERLLRLDTVAVPGIKKVIFNNPATIVIWDDGSKTITKRQKGDKKYDTEKGLAMCIAKKALGNEGNYYDIFKEYLNE